MTHFAPVSIRPLDDSFQSLLIDVARENGFPTVADPERLGPLVATLADAYNDPSGPQQQPPEGVLASSLSHHVLPKIRSELRPSGRQQKKFLPTPSLRGLEGVDHLAARLGFSLPRDIPKIAGAVREVIAQGRLSLPADRPLRVLDLGAGLGASHRGLARALDAALQTGSLDVLAVDQDSAALKLAANIAKRRPREGGVEIRLRTASANIAHAIAGVAGSAGDRRGDFTAHRENELDLRHPFDVVLMGQVITELDRQLPDDARLERHRAWLHAIMRRALTPDGILIIVEPALRPRARHLQRLRAALISPPDPVTVLAPCLHQGRCPLLGRESDWCHEDLPVDLPAWLVPVARRAHLRWEGLTFSYLIVSRNGPTLRDALPSDHRVARGVSALLVSKGKREVIVCGDPLRGTPEESGPFGPHGVRLGRLDREASPTNEDLDRIGRGVLLELEGELNEKHRIDRKNVVRILGT
ncbi:MAG: hypothetical protein NVS3B20_01250 [Polyangiales bacterium]